MLRRRNRTCGDEFAPAEKEAAEYDEGTIRCGNDYHIGE